MSRLGQVAPTGHDLVAGLAHGLTEGLLRLASATPEPAERIRTPPEELITPGTIGFLVTFAVAVALVLLIRDMVRRNRRLVLRAERRDARAKAERAGETGAAEGRADQTDAEGLPGDDEAGPRGP